MRRGLVLVVCGCGRLGFDPSGDAPTSPSIDALAGDGASVSDGPATVDAGPTACSNMNAIAVVVGTRMATTTCGTELLDGCGPANTQERVFAFTPPASQGYTVRAFDPGTNNITTSVGVVNMGCMATTGCSGVLGTSYTAGVVVYFAFESSAGGCKAIEVLVD